MTRFICIGGKQDISLTATYVDSLEEAARVMRLDQKELARQLTVRGRVDTGNKTLILAKVLVVPITQEGDDGT